MKLKKIAVCLIGVCMFALISSFAVFAATLEDKVANEQIEVKTDDDITAVLETSILLPENVVTESTEEVIAELIPEVETDMYIEEVLYSENEDAEGSIAESIPEIVFEPYITKDGTTIDLPPSARFGILRQIPKSEKCDGEMALEVFENYFEDTEEFAYPVDEVYSNNYRYVSGFEIYAEKGENVYAILDGTVIYSDISHPFGRAIVIDHGSAGTWLYAHCNDLCVNVGDEVNAGDVISHVGSSGDTAECKLYIYKY